MHGFKIPDRVIHSTSTLIDHILASFPSIVSQKSAIDVRISDHQLIFCTRKISRLKTGGIHKYLDSRSFKNYAVNSYGEALQQLDFPHYKTLDDVNGAYFNFYQKIPPYRNEKIKVNENGLIAKF